MADKQEGELPEEEGKGNNFCWFLASGLHSWRHRVSVTCDLNN